MNDFINEYLPLIIAVFCFLVPVVTLLFVVFIKQMIKRFPRKKVSHDEVISDKKKNKKAPENKTPTINYLDFFGGSDNIVSTAKNMTRVTIEVVDLEKVQFDQLRKLGIGVLITGNIVKCSSEEFAKQIGA